MGDSLEATAVLPDVAQAPVEKVVAYIRYMRTFTCHERQDAVLGVRTVKKFTG